MATAVKKKPFPRQRSDEIRPSTLSWHRIRKGVHLFCFAVFVILPFFDIMRFDIPRQRFYFAGYELWISEFAIIFYTLMFLLFLIAAISMVYGRIYCGYLCPQMIFSEAATDFENWLRVRINKKAIHWKKTTRQFLVRLISYMVLGVASVFLAFVFISYFVEPRDLLQRLLSFDIVTAGGIAGATTTIITFLDFAFVRQRFCTSVCPYGYLQGILADKSTLLVEYRDPGEACIECKKCVRVCPMGIDIRDGAHQIECVHCAECVDACVDVLGRLGQEGLIHYAWGESTEAKTTPSEPWHRKIGLRDNKRFVVLLILLFYVSGLSVALSMRHPVLVRLNPQRDVLYRVGDEGEIYNRFRTSISNRTGEKAFVEISIQDLPGSRLVLSENPITIEPGETIEQEFEVAAQRGGPAPGVNHFRFVTESIPDGARESFDMTFIMPTKEETP
jgi:polyferredoxin